MKILVNGEKTEVDADSVEAALIALGYGDARVATALNGSFLSADARNVTKLEAGDSLEIVAPRQGG